MIAAGPAMNFVLALVVFVLIFGAIGLPSDAPKIGGVLPGYPAQAAGLKAGDEVVQIDGQAMESWADILRYIQKKRWLGPAFYGAPGREAVEYPGNPECE